MSDAFFVGMDRDSTIAAGGTFNESVIRSAAMALRVISASPEISSATRSG